MSLKLRNQRSFERDHDLDDFVAELTEAAYPVALRHKGSKEWLDLQLDLWKVLAQTVKKWEQRSNLPLAK